MRVFLMPLFLIFSSGFFFYGCDQNTIKPSSTGRPGELIVVIDSLLLKSEAGRMLRDSLTASLPALPQDEPVFRVITIQPAEFKNILQLHRNILIVETGPLQDKKNFSLTFKNDVWSSPQLVLNLRATSESFIYNAVSELSSSIVEKISVEERLRLTLALRSSEQSKISKGVEDNTGINIPLTAEYFVAKQGPGYAWIRKESLHVSIGLQLFRFPYTSDSLFNVNSIIQIRDSLSKTHIPGPSSGSFMTTDHNYPYLSSTVSIDSCYGIEVRGLWKTHGDFMGGPFISYMIHDKTSNDLLFIDAFVYAPKFNKREYIKLVEAMVHAIRFDK
jgi:hypothetical protein